MERLRALAIALALLLAAQLAGAGEVEGRVSLGLEGVEIGQLGPIVVYLESTSPSAAARRRWEVRQRGVRFRPSFLVVAVGQPVAMPNDDDIFHNVFSLSAPNAFDLGIYPAGQSKTVTFDHPGLVRIYCSIHEGMTGGIFVAPTSWFDQAAPTGHYRIQDVPPGRYRLSVWNERLSTTSVPIDVPSDGRLRVHPKLGSPPK
jgi:plastocyanin